LLPFRRQPLNIVNMKRVFTDVRTWLYLISAIILVVGLSSAVVIYLNAVNTQSEVLGYEVGSDGMIYPIMPDDSKTYLRSLELYGGKFNVVTDKFRRWFTGLWHGKSLAYTVAFISILASIILFSIARHLPDSQEHLNKAG
jgi:hypothetical protein